MVLLLLTTTTSSRIDIKQTPHRESSLSSQLQALETVGRIGPLS